MKRVINQSGFSLVELAIAITFIAIAGIMIFNIGSSFFGNNKSNISIGINGLSEVRCIDGFKFVVGSHGQSRQMVNENGGGIRCE